MKKRFNSIKEDVSETTSSPAFKKVLESEYAVPILLWLFVLAGTLIGFTMHMIYIVSLYQQTPISTEITQVASSIRDFPDVTICRSFPILTLSTFIATISTPMPKFQNRTLNDFITILYGYTNGVFFNLEKERYDKLYMAVRRSEWRRIYEYLTVNITIQIQDILVSCEFNGLNCDFTDFIRYDDPVFYNCFTFDVASFTNNYSMSVGSDRVDLKLLMNTITGLGDRDETMQAMARDHTFFIDIHPSNTRPAMSENVVTETPQRMINLDVTRTEFTKMYLPDRPCFQNLVGIKSGYDILRPLTNFSSPNFYQSSFQYHFSKFTRYDCLNDEWQKLIFAKCGCFSPLSPVSRYVLDIAIATAKQPLSWCTDSLMMTDYLKINSIFSNFTIDNNLITYFFYYITKNGTVGNIAQEVNNTKAAQRLECLCSNTNEAQNLALVNNLCPSFCYQESYDIEMNLVNLEPTIDDTNSLQIYLSKKAKEVQNILNNQSGIGSNKVLDTKFIQMDLTKLSYIDISYQLSAKSIISETETYPLINLCSNIGSVMGLWIGANILVIAEVFIVTKLLLRSLCFKTKIRDKEESDTSNAKTDIVHQFVSTTSFNGINHLIASQNPLYRVFWASTLLVAFAGLAVHTYTVVALYLSSPISIEMNYDLDTDQYPAITLCPSTLTSSYLMTKTGYDHLPFTWNQLTNWTLSRLINSGIVPLWTAIYRWQHNKTGLNTTTTTIRDWMLDAAIKNSLFNFLLDLKFKNVTRTDAYSNIFGCEYSYQDCSFNNFLISYHPIYKTCFTFHSLNDNDKRLGYPEFMSILVSANDVDPSMIYVNSSLSLYRGGLFEVHPLNTVATMMYGHPYAQQSRKIVKIVKSVEQIVNSTLYGCNNRRETITLMEEDITFSGGGYSRQGHYNYSVDLCQQLRVQDAIMDQCRCLSAMLPVSLDQYSLFLSPHKCAQLPVTALRNDLTFLTINNSDFVYLNSSSRLMDLQSYIESLSEGPQFLRELSCHYSLMTDHKVKNKAVESCYSGCKEIRYQVTINSNVSPFYYQSYNIVNVYNRFFAYLKAANGTETSLMSYYVGNYYLTSNMYNYLTGFDFYFETSQTMTVMQSLSYGVVEMLSDLGGVLGLWFGISVATMFELLELLVLYLHNKH